MLLVEKPFIVPKFKAELVKLLLDVLVAELPKTQEETMFSALEENPDEE